MPWRRTEGLVQLESERGFSYYGPETQDNAQGEFTVSYRSGWKTSSGTTTSHESERRFA